MKRERHVLVVLPHPDDECGISGTLVDHIKNGTPVTYICLTLGEMGRSMGNPPFANRVSLPVIRKKELEQSCRAIGITDLRMWGVHDKTVEFEDREALIERLREAIAELQPSLIFTFYPGYSVHPDHDATGALVIQTVERMPADERPAVHCVAFSKDCETVLGPPDIVRDVSSNLKQKIGSLEAHRTQGLFLWGKKSYEDEEVKPRLMKERFWTYRFS
ncbi:bacillithiol biosynthesis deacetylase BshB2 [Paenibacillus sp. MBLB4367]|uniref:bacillithiol biosynthesis deacetylase BshB2 n=1 Tax=Paenibacillus sp. MBLB4367 TaxID=3384767 RepID=UPI0039080C0D